MHSSTQPVLDRAGALARLGHDAALLESVLQMSRQEFPVNLEQLRHALLHNDAAQLRLHAHALKGSAANVGAMALRLQAQHMEELAKRGDLQAAQLAVTALAQALDDFLHAIDTGAAAC